MLQFKVTDDSESVNLTTFCNYERTSTINDAGLAELSVNLWHNKF